MPKRSRVRRTGRSDCSTSRMISSFSVAGYLMRRRPHPRSCFFKQTVFQERLSQRFFQLPELSADILHLVRGSVAGGIAGKPLLACLEEVLRPAIVDVLVQPFTSA